MAYAKLSTGINTKSNSSAVESPVRYTHKYIRFLPKNTQEYDKMVRDSVLILYTTPLDYDIAQQGGNYHDPNLKSNPYTWLYASVPANHALMAGIQNQFLDSLYIPEEDPLLNKNTGNATNSNTLQGIQKFSITNLLDQAMAQTNNYEYVSTFKNNLHKTSYQASGVIKTFDTRLNQLIPLEGVKIRIRRWFTTNIEQTDANGYYQGSSNFSGPVNYYLFFETSRFDVRTGWFGQASINGPKQRDPWNVDLWPGDINRFYADVFRAAYRYWYGDIGGLYRPTIITAIKYAARDDFNSTGSEGLAVPGTSVFGLLPQIYIERWYDGVERTSDQIYSVTSHETAHYTHNRILLLGSIYTANTRIVESWATAVELFLTKKEYQARGITNYGDPGYNPTDYTFIPTNQAYQFGSGNDSYMPFFIDLVDDYNQKTLLSPSYLYDDITGYTMPFLETLLAIVQSPADLRTWLKTGKPSNVTDEQLDSFTDQFTF